MSYACNKQTLFVQGGTGRALILYINNGKFCVNVYNNADPIKWGSGSGTTDVLINGTTTINDGQNYIITVVYDGSNPSETLALYVNGNKEGSALSVNVPAYMGSHNNAYIGANIDGVYFENGDNSGGNNENGSSSSSKSKKLKIPEWRTKNTGPVNTVDRQQWAWCPHHKSEGLLDGLYMPHPHDHAK